MSNILDTATEIYVPRRQLRPKAKAWEEAFFDSRYRFGQMLQNRVYVGEVFLKSWRDEPAEYVQGRHEPLIDRALFERVQRLLSGRERGQKCVYREELPLRGHLLCPGTGIRLTSRATGSVQTWPTRPS